MLQTQVSNFALACLGSLSFSGASWEPQPLLLLGTMRQAPLYVDLLLVNTTFCRCLGADPADAGCSVLC